MWKSIKRVKQSQLTFTYYKDVFLLSNHEIASHIKWRSVAPFFLAARE